MHQIEPFVGAGAADPARDVEILDPQRRIPRVHAPRQISLADGQRSGFGPRKPELKAAGLIPRTGEMLTNPGSSAESSSNSLATSEPSVG